MRKNIPVSEPVLCGNEKEYVVDCLDTAWISSNGKYIDLFEKSFADYLDVKHAVSVCNGTVALHAALLALGVGPGDEILVPTLTYVATANAVNYCGARPVFVDSEIHTWNIDPAKIEEKITNHTKGIIVVHLYGHPADMDPILELANHHGLFVLEDAAEAHGAEYKGKKAGTLGLIGTFSFYGNKILTTGEGGVIVTDDDQLARKMRQIKGQGQDIDRRYWFPIVGYNYRMTNIEAAIGLAQLEMIDWHIQRRREVAGWYAERLANISSIKMQPEMPWAKNVYWMSSIVLENDNRITRDEVIELLAQHGIETRPFFYPMHVMPVYGHADEFDQYPTANYLSTHGINLPSSAAITKEEVEFVSDSLISIIN